MEEEEKKEQYPPIVDQLREYAETRIKIARYKAIDKGTSAVAGMVTGAVTAVCFILTFLFASFTLALFLAKVLGSYWQGFGIVALIYLIIAVVVKAAKNSIKKPLIDLMVRGIFSDND